MSRVIDGTPDRRAGSRFSTGAPDDAFQQSMARLSLHLATRHSTVLLPAPRPLPLARRWTGWPYLVLLVVVGAGAIGYQYSTFDPPEAKTPTITEAAPVSAAPVKILAPAAFAAQPAPAVPPPVPTVEEPPVVKASLSMPKAVEPVQAPADSTARELTWAEVLELQRRLASLGINPGPLDGIAGPRTLAGVQRYQELKGLAATGNVDRQMLKLLQQDSGPSATLEARAQ